MSEALAIIDVPMPPIRPKGVTAKQWRLAAIYPRAESAYAALVAAGYSPKNASQNSRQVLDSLGAKRARESQAGGLADKARGIMAVGQAALASVTADLKELDPRDRIAAGFKAVELAHAIGENIEAKGDAKGWKYRLRRAIALAYYLGRRSVERASPPTT